jgi:hypothetical protein
MGNAGSLDQEINYLTGTNNIIFTDEDSMDWVDTRQ